MSCFVSFSIHFSEAKSKSIGLSHQVAKSQAFQEKGSHNVLVIESYNTHSFLISDPSPSSALHFVPHI